MTQPSDEALKAARDLDAMLTPLLKSTWLSCSASVWIGCIAKHLAAFAARAVEEEREACEEACREIGAVMARAVQEKLASDSDLAWKMACDEVCPLNSAPTTPYEKHLALNFKAFGLKYAAAIRARGKATPQDPPSGVA